MTVAYLAEDWSAAVDPVEDPEQGQIEAATPDERAHSKVGRVDEGYGAHTCGHLRHGCDNRHESESDPYPSQSALLRDYIRVQGKARAGDENREEANDELEPDQSSTILLQTSPA